MCRPVAREEERSAGYRRTHALLRILHAERCSSTLSTSFITTWMSHSKRITMLEAIDWLEPSDYVKVRSASQPYEPHDTPMEPRQCSCM
jgi:hypothetical protein